MTALALILRLRVEVPELKLAVAALETEARRLESSLRISRQWREACVKGGHEECFEGADRDVLELEQHLDTLYKGGATPPKGGDA